MILAIAAGDLVRVFDPASGKEILTLAHESAIARLFFTRDGKGLITASKTRADYWEASTGRQLWSTDPLDQVIDIFSDGEVLALANQRGAIELWDIRPSRPVLSKSWAALAVAVDLLVGRGGTEIGAYVAPKRLLFRHVETGKTREFSSEELGPRLPRGTVALSRDGTTLGYGSPSGVVEIWEFASRERRLKIEPPKPPAKAPSRGRAGFLVKSLEFSADGRKLATVGPGRGINVFDAYSGKDLFHPAGVTAALSPDGNILATAKHNGMIHLWEIRTQGEICRIKGGPTQVTSLAFSPRNRFLASANDDRTVLVWNLMAIPGVTALSADQIKGDELWMDLASRNARIGYRALATLVAAGKQGVEYLRAHLMTQGPVNANRVRALIEALRSPIFQTRQHATRELALLGERVQKDLQAALKATSSLEERQRLDLLLKKIDTSLPPPYRDLRAVQALETLASADAEKLLGNIAAGDPDAPRTQEANLALKRMARR
jgi:hypothetical protein